MCNERNIRMKNCEKYKTVDAREKAFSEYDRQETIADIVSEMRNEGHTGDASCLEWIGAKMQRYADRIEAANHRFREVAKMIPHEEVAATKMEATDPTAEDFSPVCDAAAMHEAVDKLLNFLRWEYAQDYPAPRDKLADAIDIGVAALSTPPRNCDVGTVDAQVSRYNKFCMQRACSECPFYVASDLLACGVRWAQMPYEEEE